jgi:hypothetical protein
VQVRQRYLALNAHAASYTWKALGRTAGAQEQEATAQTCGPQEGAKPG